MLTNCSISNHFDMNINSEDSVLVGESIELSEELNSDDVGLLPSLAYNSTEKEYIAVWDFVTNQGRTVTSQRFSSTGSLIGENIKLSQSANINIDPVVAYNKIDNQYLVSFRVQEDPILPFNSSVGQLLEADSELIGGNFAIDDAGLEISLLHNPEVNEYFQTSRIFEPNNKIFSQQISAEGDLIGSSVRLDPDETDSAPNGEVAFNSVDNQYLATWRRQDPDYAVEGRLIDANGTLISEVIEITQPLTAQGAPPFDPIFTEFDPINTQFFVAYNLPQEQQISAQLVDADGTLIGEEILLSDGFFDGAVGIDFSESLGIYLLTGTNESGLFGQFISASGNLLEEPFPIADDIISGSSVIANDDLQEFAVAWTEGGTTEGIFAQRLNPSNLFDIISGTPNEDFLVGTQAKDFIDGRNNIDLLIGRNGDDTLDGGTGEDRLYGNQGNDGLLGGDGRDFLVGGKGDDLLDGGADDDLLLGNMGADQFVLREGDGLDRIFDYGDGTDSFLLDNGLAFEDLTITQGAGQSLISVTDTNEKLVALFGVNASDIGAENFSTNQVLV
jgi:Ca2+-binding RTX toxin-like protein